MRTLAPFFWACASGIRISATVWVSTEPLSCTRASPFATPGTKTLRTRAQELPSQYCSREQCRAPGQSSRPGNPQVWDLLGHLAPVLHRAVAEVVVRRIGGSASVDPTRKSWGVCYAAELSDDDRSAGVAVLLGIHIRCYSSRDLRLDLHHARQFCWWQIARQCIGRTGWSRLLSGDSVPTGLPLEATERLQALHNVSDLFQNVKKIKALVIQAVRMDREN